MLLGCTCKMNWNNYLKEIDERKRWDTLQKENRLSYDHVDDWLMSLKYFIIEEVKNTVNNFNGEGYTDKEIWEDIKADLIRKINEIGENKK